MTAVVPLTGRQTPTFLWVPEHTESHGQEVIDLAAQAGLILDPWQQLLVRLICALSPAWAWLCFEVLIIVSRQNGKGGVLEALELAWLFLFGDRLITHSAHLFETSREHFLRMQALIRDHDAFRRRVRRMREGRGAEEIELTSGERLKFMTRKGGAGRGFTGSKVVLDEAMFLDASMMAAALPTLATEPNAQVIYTGSAGMRHSTHMALTRRRGLARNEPALMFAEWAAEKAIYGPDGTLISGDDPADPATWAKVNPAYGIRISREYIRREMATLGGPRSREFGTERLGIGDYPGVDATWEVISEEIWAWRADPTSRIAERQPIALAIDADPDRAMGTIGACGLREDGRDHVEVIERHRGTGWIVDALTGAARPAGPDDLPDYQAAVLQRMRELRDRHRIGVVVMLKTAATGNLIDALRTAGFRVETPSEIVYAQWCGAFVESVTETGTLVHIDQDSVRAALGGARKRPMPEGAWRWSRSAPADPGPVIALTLALGGRRTFPATPPPRIW